MAIFFIVKYYYEKYSSRIQSDHYYINLSFLYFLHWSVRDCFFVGEKRAQNRVINDVRKLVDEKINVSYEDFNDGKIILLNIYKETLEKKSVKMLNYK